MDRAQGQTLATILALSFADAGLALVARNREALANLVWAFKSWERPADRNAAWQQRIGRRTDPYDRLKRGI